VAQDGAEEEETMTTLQQSGTPAGQRPLVWLDSLARVVTVWGLGLGTAITATLAAALVYRLGGGSFLLEMVLALVVGATAAGGVVYLDYVKAHFRMDPAWEARSAKVVSSLVTLVALFAVALLLSSLMLPILAAGILYVRSRRQRGESWRKRAEMFIGEAMPRIAFL